MTKTEWNLKKQYAGLDDPALEKDIQKIERAYKAFEKKYRRATTYLEKASALKLAIEAYEKLYVLPKPLSYLYLAKTIDTNNKVIDAKIASAGQRIVRAANRVAFFRLNLGSIPSKTQKLLLKDSNLAPYHYFLAQVFEHGRHNLGEQETTLLNELSLPAGEMWIDLTERLQSERVIEFQGEEIPLSAAQGLLSSLKKKDRSLLWNKVRTEFKADASVAEAELNALCTAKAIVDQRRNYQEPFEETLLDFETTKRELDALRSAVQEEVSLPHEFYLYKRDSLKLKTLTYADRNVESGSFNRTFSFKESKEILRRVLQKSDPIFVRIFDGMLEGGRIDVYPRKGKTSGAFCSGNIEFPTFVLLNHVNTLDSLSTLAHEMGHAIHTELAKRNRPLYQGYSTATAEFASTFFEELLFNELKPELSAREQKVLLHNRVNRDISTVFRQMAFFEFELALHTEVRTKGYVPKERIAELLNQKSAEYLGKAVTLEDDDGYFFVPLSHVRRFFYVYSYAYGGLLSRLVLKRSIDNPELFQDVTELLSSGSSMSPKNLFTQIGMNTEKKETFKDALALVRADFEHLKTS